MSKEKIDILNDLVHYIVSHHPSAFNFESLPRNQSLLDMGVLDSAGLIEFIVFSEDTWGIEIADDDISTERMGSLDKMADLVHEYSCRRQP